MDKGLYVMFSQSMHLEPDLDRFITKVITESARTTFYQCTPEDKSIRPGTDYYMAPTACKIGRCIVMAVCVLNFVRTYPSFYSVYGLAIGYPGEPTKGYSRVLDGPHTLAILKSKTTGDLIALDLTEQGRSGKAAHVFVAKTIDRLLDLIRDRYGVYQPGGFWTSFRADAFDGNMFSVYSAAVHKVMQRKTDERLRVGNNRYVVYENYLNPDLKHIRRNGKMIPVRRL